MRWGSVRLRTKIAIGLTAVLLVTAVSAVYSPDPQVSRLLIAFWVNRPYGCGVDIGPTARTKLVDKLRKLPGDAPRSALVRLLRWHLLVGPRAWDHIWHDADYCGVMREGLIGLTRWADDPGVLALASALTDGDRWYPKIDSVIQAQAHRILLLHEMRQNGVNSDETAVAYLASQVSGTGGGHSYDWARPGLLTSESARNVAIGDLLKEYDEAAVPALREALQTTPPSERRRYEALQYYVREIGTLRPMLEKLNRRPMLPLDCGLRR